MHLLETLIELSWQLKLVLEGVRYFLQDHVGNIKSQ